MTEREEIKELKRRRRQKRLGVLCFLLAVLSVAMILCVAMFFNIETITVTGNQRYTSDLITASSGILTDQNIFAVDTRRSAEQVKDGLYYLESVRVVRRLPSTIEIQVVESEPAVIAANAPDEYTLLSDNGRIIEHCIGVSGEDLPILIGVDLSTYPEGSYAQDCVPDKYATLSRILDAVTESGITGIKYIDLSDELSSTVLYDNRVLIELGSELDLTKKLSEAREILENYKSESAAGTLNMSISGKGYFKNCDIGPLMDEVYMESYFKYG